MSNERDPNNVPVDRLTLWAHIIARHACIMSTTASMEDLRDYHQGEHEGPGTIRNHAPDLFDTNLHRIGEVLIEAEPGDDEPDPDAIGPEAEPIEQCSQCGEIILGAHGHCPGADDDPDPYEGSFCEAADNEGARIAREDSDE